MRSPVTAARRAASGGAGHLTTPAVGKPATGYKLATLFGNKRDETERNNWEGVWRRGGAAAADRPPSPAGREADGLVRRRVGM